MTAREKEKRETKDNIAELAKDKL